MMVRRMLALMMFSIIPLHAEIFTVFSDKGISGESLAPVGSVVLNAFSGDVPPPEGLTTFKSEGTGGWEIVNNVPQNLTRFQPGMIMFWLRTVNVGQLFVEVESANPPGSKRQWIVNIPTQYWGQWVQVPLIIADVDLSQVKKPFIIWSNTPGTFYVDRVRYKTSQNFMEFNVEVKNTSNGQAAGQLSYSPGTLPKTWVRADQYLSIDIDPDSDRWGIQIYTDNTAADADGKFVSGVPSGQPGSNPAGLVDKQNPARRLPMAWTITALGSALPVAADPTNSSDPNSSRWLFVADRATPAIQAENTAAFQNGNIYQTIATNQGIHYGQSAGELGAENSPFLVYVQANFAGAVSPRTYQTNKLIIEYYYP